MYMMYNYWLPTWSSDIYMVIISQQPDSFPFYLPSISAPTVHKRWDGQVLQVKVRVHNQIWLEHLMFFPFQMINNFNPDFPYRLFLNFQVNTKYEKTTHGYVNFPF